MTQLVEKRKKEVANKTQAEHDSTQQAETKIRGIDRGSEKGTHSPSPETEEEIDEQT